MTTSFERIREAAGLVDELVADASTPSAAEHFEFTAFALREMADQVKRENVLAQRLRDAHRAGLGLGHESLAVLSEKSQERWRAVAREAMAAHAEAEPLRVGWTAPGQGHAVGDTFHLPAEDLPATIPADATGLKGKRAKIIGPLRFLDRGSFVSIEEEWFGTTEVSICSDPDKYGDLLASAVDGANKGTLQHIAASSLALIPDEPEAVPEPPVGTRLRDKDGVVWVRDLEAEFHRWRRADGVTGWTWSEVQNFGPLHQVWEDESQAGKDG